MTEAPSPNDFGPPPMDDFRVFLLRSILRRFAHPGLPTSPAPRPAQAARALEADAGGGLLRAVCDVWSIPFGELASRSKVGQTSISSYVLGTRPLEREETKAVSSAVHDMITERARVPA